MNYRIGFFSFFITFTLLFIIILPLSAEDKIHIVTKGDTVYSVARLYGIKQDELMKYNSITDASKLQLGYKLKIPQSASGVLPSSPVSGNNSSSGSQTTETYTNHVVQKVDTLFSLARTYNTTVQKIKEINGLTSDVIRVGSSLKVPAKPGTVVNTKPVNPPPPPAVNPGTPANPSVKPNTDARITSTKDIDASLRWPVTPKEIAYMTGKLYGVAIVAERSESVKSLTQGTVISAGPYRGFGRVVIVEVPEGYLYVYGGCEKLSVKEGDRVGSGMELGKLGIDAVSGKPQLFFMVYKSNAPIDPAKAPRG